MAISAFKCLIKTSILDGLTVTSTGQGLVITLPAMKSPYTSVILRWPYDDFSTERSSENSQEVNFVKNVYQKNFKKIAES